LIFGQLAHGTVDPIGRVQKAQKRKAEKRYETLGGRPIFIKNMENLKIIGSSHIAEQSINDVKAAIDSFKPDIIALELDKRRFYSLTGKKGDKKEKIRLSDMMKVGFSGYLFSIIGAYVEKKLGNQVGVIPGSEMIAAARLAKKNNIKVALIDQDIEITLKRFSKEFSWKEKFRIISDIFRGIFFKKSELKKIGLNALDLTKVPEKEVIKKLTAMVKKRYPNLYKVLIEERNIVMANNIAHILKADPDKRVLAVMGAGHEEEIEQLIKG